MLTKEQVEALLDGTTPGPWTMESETLFGKDFGYTVDLFDVAPYDTNERFEADARLIAAAPTLARTALDALARAKKAEQERDALREQHAAEALGLHVQMTRADRLAAQLAEAQAQVAGLLKAAQDVDGFMRGEKSYERSGYGPKLRAALATHTGKEGAE